MPATAVRVLLIEDDDGDADLLRALLAEAPSSGIALERVNRLQAALERLKQGGVNVVLSDLNLPDSSGPGTFTRVREVAPELPIVMITGFDDEAFALEAVRQGVQDYLVKGQVDGRLLVRVIRYAIERKRVERELARLASFPEQSPSPIVEVDRAGRVTYQNPAARAQFPDLETQGAQHPLLAGLTGLVETLKRSGKPSVVRELTIGPHDYEQRLSLVAEGTLMRGYVLDITERKQMDRLKEEFIGNVSHELRTPLSIIKEGISLLLDKIPGPINEQQEKLLRVSRDNMDRLARIINGLLDISKLEAGRVELKRSRMDLREPIRQVIAAFELRATTKGLALNAEVPDEPLPVDADLDKVIQILTNLVGNAMKFTERGGITITAKADGGVVECRVRDTGPGIAPEHLPKMFNRFQQFGRTTGPGEKGTGLGLAITKGLVELHGGTIRVESTVGEGTTFVFTLPRGPA